MNQSKFAFQKTDDINTDLYIYGEIRPMDFWDMIFGDDPTRTGAFDFKTALSKVDTPNLTVRINSPGGYVSEGLAIYTLLNEWEGNLTTIVDGMACSAASVIFMAGKKRIVPESGLLMIHNASISGVSGDSNALKKYAEDLEKITQPSVNIYTSKTNLTEEKIKEMMDREQWITSKEAFEWGFATSVEKDGAKQSLETNYLYNLVRRIKELEVTRVQSKNGVADPHEEKSSWNGFFNKKGN